MQNRIITATRDDLGETHLGEEWISIGAMTGSSIVSFLNAICVGVELELELHFGFGSTFRT